MIKVLALGGLIVASSLIACLAVMYQSGILALLALGTVGIAVIDMVMDI